MNLVEAILRGDYLSLLQSFNWIDRSVTRQSFNYASAITWSITTTITAGRCEHLNISYPIVITVRPIVASPLTEIEDLVSCQAVPVLVELYLAAGGICKMRV